MSIAEDLKALPLETASWMVKVSILQYLTGVELAYRRLDDDGSEFRLFVGINGLPIRKASDYRYMGAYNSPDYRGMIAVALDDLGFRDPDQRDAVMEFLTGSSRVQEEEAYRRHRISQGDSWLESPGKSPIKFP